MSERFTADELAERVRNVPGGDIGGIDPQHKQVPTTNFLPVDPSPLVPRIVPYELDLENPPALPEGE